MSVTVKKIIGYALLVAGTVVMALLSWLFGLPLLIAGCVLIVLAQKQKSTPGPNEMFARQLQFNRIRETGDRIQVDFQLCKVVASQSIKAETEYSDAAVFLAGRTLNAVDRLLDDGPPIGSTLHQSVFIFEHEWKGKSHKFISPIIPKDPVTLEFLIASQKSTTLYVDKNDPRMYFFDLMFLQN